jgi:hypothetical protein
MAQTLAPDNTPPAPPTADGACPHCGYLDLRHYADEATICPHCGVVLAETPPAPGWLAQWPAPSRSALAQLFYLVIRRGTLALPAVVAQVADELETRLQWTSDPEKRRLCCEVLQSLRDDPGGAQDYAGEVLALEQLPAAEKAHLKEGRSKPYVLEAMKGKPITDKQRWLIRSKGYTGELPADRAAASEIIDALLRKGRL